MKPLPDNYQELAAADKQALLWDNVRSTAYDDNALPTIGMVRYVLHASFGGLFSVKQLQKSFRHVSDEMPPGRVKIVHPYGSVACVRLEPTPGHPFTGLFRSGAVGLVRVGPALPAKSFTPGMAYKFFAAGRPSANMVIIPDLMGQGGDYNVFARRGSNKLPPFHGLMLSVIKVMFLKASLALGSKDLEWDRLPVDMMAATTAAGQSESTPCAPYEIVFDPMPEARTSSTPLPDYRLNLKAVPSGTPLYRISGRPSADADLLPMGLIRSTSDFVASRYGDGVLFFQHDPGILAVSK
jgi:hypothetical protein